MSKLIFFGIPAQGHVNPSLPVIAQLVQRGEEVVYANTEEFRQQIEATGARFQPYPHIEDLERLMRTVGVGDLAQTALAMVRIAEQLMPFTQALIAQENPDCLMHDTLASWAEMTKRRLKMQAVVLCVTFVVTPRISLSLPPVLLVNSIRQFARVLPDYWQVARRIRRRYGTRSVGLVNALMSLGEMNIVFTSRLFQPHGQSFGDAFQFVGTSFSLRPHQADFPFEQLTGSPLVYISLGTINNLNLAFYRACFEAFANHPGQFILSIGKNTAPEALGHAPPNFIVHQFVPQLDLLRRADVFVTHGGLNSTHEGLFYGVPLIVIPQQTEQAIVARQVVKHGAGISLGDAPPFGHVSAAALRQALDAVLAKSADYEARASIIGDSLRDAGGPARAADTIQAFSRRGSA